MEKTSNIEVIKALESLSSRVKFGEVEWEELKIVADIWIKSQNTGYPKPPIYTSLKKVLEKFPKQIGEFLAQEKEPQYREFILYHSRVWSIFCLMSAYKEGVRQTEYTSNILLWNRKIENSVQILMEQSQGKKLALENFAEYANGWILVKSANKQPSATYSMTKFIRDNTLDELLNHISSLAKSVEQPAHLHKYRRIYLYLHFHVRNWKQFQELRRLPNPIH